MQLYIAFAPSWCVSVNQQLVPSFYYKSDPFVRCERLSLQVNVLEQWEIIKNSFHISIISDRSLKHILSSIISSQQWGWKWTICSELRLNLASCALHRPSWSHSKPSSRRVSHRVQLLLLHKLFNRPFYSFPSFALPMPLSS